MAQQVALLPEDEPFDVFEYLNLYAPPTTIVPQLISVAPAFSILFRNARRRDYFQIVQGQTMHIEPYKYNVRISGDKSIYSCYLYVQHGEIGNEEYIPFGMNQEKQIQIRGAPANSIDYRVSFSVVSRSYKDASFIVKVFDTGNQKQVCQSNSFILAGRARSKPKNM